MVLVKVLVGFLGPGPRKGVPVTPTQWSVSPQDAPSGQVQCSGFRAFLGAEFRTQLLSRVLKCTLDSFAGEGPGGSWVTVLDFGGCTGRPTWPLCSFLGSSDDGVDAGPLWLPVGLT